MKSNVCVTANNYVLSPDLDEEIKNVTINNSHLTIYLRLHIHDLNILYIYI